MKAFRGGARILGAAGLALSSWAGVAATAPSPFEADTARHALIVVDALVQRKSLLATQESPVVAGTLRVKTPGVRKPHDHSTKAFGEVLVFAVEPGRYRPGSVTTRMPKMQVGTGTMDLVIPLPSDSMRALDHVVAAGSVVYVGRIGIMTLPRAFRQNDYRFTLNRDDDRERKVWERLLDLGKPGAWESLIQRRLDAITVEADSIAAADTLQGPLGAPADSAR